jgi:hypothetical protein
MIHCPKCHSAADHNATICATCGHIFRDIEPLLFTKYTGNIFSWWSDTALVFGEGISCLIFPYTIFSASVAIFKGEILTGLVLCPLLTIFSLGMFIVFRRVREY